MKVVHGYIFQDVYPWAGEFRTINISKGGHLFGVAAFVEPALHELLRELAGEDCLKGSDLRTFALRVGFMIDWSRVTREQMMTASLESFKTSDTGDSSEMAAWITLSTVEQIHARRR